MFYGGAGRKKEDTGRNCPPSTKTQKYGLTSYFGVRSEERENRVQKEIPLLNRNIKVWALVEFWCYLPICSFLRI